ncbi:MAG: type II toxin-antitoxin system RelE/ParE family toxin [Mesorhizobium sp.]|nr:MAG: type II toxin-antitoxin system RelE/ParE family toxin [Mesorhizobium sp.]TIN26787.1 MAG: type II toxin-antitoxin system RelE/ParE family toxin [Mesorhizobium sp.]TIN41717.1 MAG: type II toxin-antitoxin system RelE/ParE family toxin [Mesorhizobium sp.]TJU86260.1 MAG: type II toxin-antitoxin system RelE/ParE family toxin [Mesorhizobium sp.]TJU89011.1 MAG: type II toxin-antitoxin system RelE/ParE family toxin [Mesorhizobium sp.]
MQRLEVEYRETARNDLADIFRNIIEAGGSPEVALKFPLPEHRQLPRGGRSRDDIAPGLRTVPFEHSAIIAYVVDDDVVRIVNIFYGGRDYEALMRDGGSSEAS